MLLIKKRVFLWFILLSMLANKIRPIQDVMRMHAADAEQNIKQQ